MDKTACFLVAVLSADLAAALAAAGFLGATLSPPPKIVGALEDEGGYAAALDVGLGEATSSPKILGALIDEGGYAEAAAAGADVCLGAVGGALLLDA